MMMPAAKRAISRTPRAVNTLSRASLPIMIHAIATRIGEMALTYGMRPRMYPTPPSHL